MSNTASAFEVYNDFDTQNTHSIYGLRTWRRVLYVLVSFFFLNAFSAPTALASDYSASITTDGDVNLTTLSGQTVIEDSNINVISNCKAGYNLTLKTSVEDNNLYLDGDASNNTTGSFISSANGVSTLSDSSNSWGYFVSSSLTIPTTSSVFFAGSNCFADCC